MWLFILFYVVLPIAALYAFTATIFLFLAQLEKNTDGKLVLDPDSWHFKVAYPFGRGKVLEALKVLNSGYAHTYRGEQARILLESYRRGLCAYFFKFFVMLYFAWPFLAAFTLLVNVVANVFFLLFGCYRILDFGDNLHIRRYPLPRVYGQRLLPVYILVPLLYAALWYAYPADTPVLTGYVALAIGAIIAMVAIFWATVAAVVWLGSTDKGSVSMVREWVSAKKQGMCPLTEIKISDSDV